MTRKLWDFLDGKKRNVIADWIREQSKRDRAKLDQKFDRLEQIDFELAIATKLLAGPIAKQKHIYKMTVHGEVQLRPMLCKGPSDMDHEYTMLLGAVEKGYKLTPSAEKAEANRSILVQNPDQRCDHERIKT